MGCVVHLTVLITLYGYYAGREATEKRADFTARSKKMPQQAKLIEVLNRAA